MVGKGLAISELQSQLFNHISLLCNELFEVLLFFPKFINCLAEFQDVFLELS